MKYINRKIRGYVNYKRVVNRLVAWLLKILPGPEVTIKLIMFLRTLSCCDRTLKKGKRASIY